MPCRNNYVPAKNSRKIFVPGRTYHVYNRGVNGQTVFKDDQDYRVFLYYLKILLSNPENLKAEYPNVPLPKSFSNEIDLLSYCLMPNHYHLLVRQENVTGMTNFMRSLIVSYCAYFNQHHKRYGSLFQGVYKAVMAETSLDIVKVSRYINLNPIIEKVDDDFRIVRDKNFDDVVQYRYSSLRHILGKYQVEWVKAAKLLDELKDTTYSNLSYSEFLQKCETGGVFTDF